MTAAGWPPGMRVILRRERPHPGAQLRITDRDGWRLTAFATNTKCGRLPAPEIRHRLRARAEDRIRCLKDGGLRNLPLHEFNQIWLETVLLAADLLAWTGQLAFTDQPARRWEPKRWRLRLLNTAGRSRALETTDTPAAAPQLAVDRPHQPRSPPPRSVHLNADPAPPTKPDNQRPERWQLAITSTATRSRRRHSPLTIKITKDRG